jgi:hypothetical protein
MLRKLRWGMLSFLSMEAIKRDKKKRCALNFVHSATAQNENGPNGGGFFTTNIYIKYHSPQITDRSSKENWITQRSLKAERSKTTNPNYGACLVLELINWQAGGCSSFSREVSRVPTPCSVVFHLSSFHRTSCRRRPRFQPPPATSPLPPPPFASLGPFPPCFGARATAGGERGPLLVVVHLGDPRWVLPWWCSLSPP